MFIWYLDYPILLLVLDYKKYSTVSFLKMGKVSFTNSQHLDCNLILELKDIKFKFFTLIISPSNVQQYSFIVDEKNFIINSNLTTFFICNSNNNNIFKIGLLTYYALNFSLTWKSRYYNIINLLSNEDTKRQIIRTF